MKIDNAKALKWLGQGAQPTDRVEKGPRRAPRRHRHEALVSRGGLCLVLGVPGTGKSVIKQSLQRLPERYSQKVCSRLASYG